MSVNFSDLSPDAQAQVRRQHPEIKGKSHYNVAAIEDRTVDGILFGSKLEAGVYVYLKANRRSGEKLLCHVTVPLWSAAPTCGAMGRRSINVDFICVGLVGDVWQIKWAVDAKPKRRKSREWKRGADAFEASYGFRISEMSEVPE